MIWQSVLIVQWVSSWASSLFFPLLTRPGRWWEFIYRWICTYRTGAWWWERCRWSFWRTPPLWWTGWQSGGPGAAGGAYQNDTAESGTWNTTGVKNSLFVRFHLQTVCCSLSNYRTPVTNSSYLAWIRASSGAPAQLQEAYCLINFIMKLADYSQLTRA